MRIKSRPSGFFAVSRRVMLDADLAEVYEVTTKRLNEQVKRNIDRLPGRLPFQADEGREN